MRVVSISLALLVLGACKNDQGFTPRRITNVATTVGDFDDVGAPLDRLLVDYVPHDGVISTVVWDPDFEPGVMRNTVEGLFASRESMLQFDAIFVASGTRGMGGRVYNGLLPDDAFVSDPAVVDNFVGYVDSGGVLLFTDWSYDMVEACWPDALHFLQEDDGYDAAQLGEIGTISASVVDAGLAQDLDSDAIAITFDFSNWAVIDGTGPGVQVWARGPATYRKPNGGFRTLDDAPLLVSFEPSKGAGTVVLSSFHLDAQNAGAIDTILRTIVGDFQPAQEAP